MPAGRPRTLDRAAIMNGVAARMASGELVKHAAQAIGVDPRRICEWGITDEYAPLYARARESQCHALAEDIIEIADEKVDSSEQAQRNRLRVDTRKWYVSKLAPKIFGDRIESNVTITVASLHLDALKANPNRVTASLTPLITAGTEPETVDAQVVEDAEVSIE